MKNTLTPLQFTQLNNDVRYLTGELNEQQRRHKLKICADKSMIGIVTGFETLHEWREDFICRLQIMITDMKNEIHIYLTNYSKIN